MEDRLREIFRNTFNMEELDPDDSPETIEEWDSMGHLSLIAAIEKEFQISIPAGVVGELLDVASIQRFLNKEAPQ